MMDHHEPQDDTPIPAAPRAHLALSHLFAQAVEPGASPAQVEAARVLAALWTAAVHIGGGDAHVEHWLTNAPDLSAPRRILGAHKVGARGPRPGRLVAADLAAHDTDRPEHRQAVREIITHALTHAAGATS